MYRNRFTLLAGTCALAATLLPIGVTLADTQDAHCTLYQNGQQKANATGKCEFYQSQGNVEVTTRDGKTYRLRMGEMDGEYFDGQQNSVMRSISGEGRLVFKWPHQQLSINLNESALSGGGSHGGGGNSSGTPSEFRELVGQNTSEVMDEMTYRGYKIMKRDGDAANQYISWQNQESGACVMAHVTHGTYQSLVYTSEFDCRR